MNDKQAEAAIEQIRRWLAGGATIKATDPSAPILVPLPNGTIVGNLTITYPP